MMFRQTFHIPSVHVLDESITSGFICLFISNQPNLKSSMQNKKYEAQLTRTKSGRNKNP